MAWSFQTTRQQVHGRMNEKDDWHRQLNIYAWLVEHAKGLDVHKLQMIAIIRDWSAREAFTKEGYPQSPIVTIDIPKWDPDVQDEFIQIGSKCIQTPHSTLKWVTNYLNAQQRICGKAHGMGIDERRRCTSKEGLRQ